MTSEIREASWSAPVLWRFFVQWHPGHVRQIWPSTRISKVGFTRIKFRIVPLRKARPARICVNPRHLGINLWLAGFKTTRPFAPWRLGGYSDGLSSLRSLRSLRLKSAHPARTLGSNWVRFFQKRNVYAESLGSFRNLNVQGPPNPGPSSSSSSSSSSSTPRLPVRLGPFSR